MTAPLDQYLRLRAELARIRWAHAGFESPEEDALLDRMDEAWARLSEADLTELERHPAPSQLTRPMARWVHGQVARVDTDVFAYGAIAPRRLGEVA
jgi:hypothetical protein